jgi:hypothetical protein
MITRLVLLGKHYGLSDGDGINTPESSIWKLIGGEKYVYICATVQIGSFYGASDILYCSSFFIVFVRNV